LTRRIAVPCAVHGDTEPFVTSIRPKPLREGEVARGVELHDEDVTIPDGGKFEGAYARVKVGSTFKSTSYIAIS